MLFLNSFLNFLGHTLFERILSVALLTAVAYLAYRWVLEPLHVILSGMWHFWKLRNRPSVILEIIPPEHTEKPPLATQQLFTVLQQLIGKNEVLPLEIDATHKEGIRYLIHAHPADTVTLQRQIASYLPEAKIRVLESTAKKVLGSHSRVMEVKQAHHYAYPLLAHEELSQSDPIAYITGAMAKLKSNEKIVMQVVIAPHHSRSTAKLRNEIESTGYAVLGNKLRYFARTRPFWVWAITILYGLFTRDLKATASLLVILLVVSLVGAAASSMRAPVGVR